MSRGGMFNLATFSSPRTPVAFLKLTLQSWESVRGVSGKNKKTWKCKRVISRRSTSCDLMSAKAELEEPLFPLELGLITCHPWKVG